MISSWKRYRRTTSNSKSSASGMVYLLPRRKSWQGCNGPRGVLSRGPARSNSVRRLLYSELCLAPLVEDLGVGAVGDYGGEGALEDRLEVGGVLADADA